jgi:hypothetical protein
MQKIAMASRHARSGILWKAHGLPLVTEKSFWYACRVNTRTVRTGAGVDDRATAVSAVGLTHVVRPAEPYKDPLGFLVAIRMTDANESIRTAEVRRKC